MVVLAASAALAGCGGSSDDDVASARAEGAAQARLEERAKVQSEETARLRREVERLKEPKAKERAVTTVVERPSAAAPARPAAAATRPASTRSSSSWPAWTVQLASFPGRADADAAAAKARANGLPDVGVLDSGEHSSLRAGYWMVYSGVSSQSVAQSGVGRARSAGFADALARYVTAD